MSNRKLKVYGTNTHLLGIQARTIAAVTSQKEFAALIGSSLGYVREYGCETGNPEEMEQAMSNIGSVMIKCPTCHQWHKKEQSRG
jgi:hypothetical protein